MKQRLKNDAARQTPGKKPEWKNVRRVLVVRLRSIGDTVLATPSLVALRRFLPAAQIDVLLEDWVAPLLDDFAAVDNVLTVKRGDTRDRLRVMYKIARRGYDVAYNLHGGTTAGFFVAASRAKHRVGFQTYQNKFLYNFLAPPATEFWRQPQNHSAEQQLALLGWTGVFVADKPASHLTITDAAQKSLEVKLKSKIQNLKSKIALLHPAAAFETKQWATENFARVADFFDAQGFSVAAVGTPKEREVLDKLKQFTAAPIETFTDLSLPEITALAARSAIFVGNDSGIAHIAAAVETPSVVVFGSSNAAHWRPWTNAPSAIVREEMLCAPCAGYFCTQFEQPECIRRVTIESVTNAIETILRQTEKH